MTDTASAETPLAAARGNTPESDGTMPGDTVRLAMIALIMALFVASLSNLVVLTALPRVVGELGGDQASYTWIVSASMILMAVCMPLWGSLAGRIDKKRAIQLNVLGYVTFSMIAGLAGSTTVIIACRAGIGVCASGIIILMQAIAAEITTPRQRARWIGYQGAAISVATVGAPSLGGVVAEHLGWRWCFFMAVPLAAVSVAMLQRSLRLPRPVAPKDQPIDWAGAVLGAVTIMTLMIWVSVVGPRWGWTSAPSLLLLFAGLALGGILIAVERRVRTAIIPLELLRHREILPATIAACGTGFAFYSSAVFMAILLQLGLGYSPQVAGLMALPEAGGTLCGALFASRFIARHGHYRGWLIAGALLACLGFIGLARVGIDTTLVYVGVCVAAIGGGLGIVSENLVLVVQTAVERRDIGRVLALVNFSRMAGGVLAVAGLGALLAYRVSEVSGAAHAVGGKGDSLPRLDQLDAAARRLAQLAYVEGSSGVFLACVPVAIVVVACVILLPARVLEAHPRSH